MRTTVDIPDQLYRELKVKAALEGITIRQLTLRGLEREIAQGERARIRKLTRPPLKSHASGSIRIDNEQIYDVIGFP